MDESLLDKARRLRAVAEEAQAVLKARHDAKRLTGRTTDLQQALTRVERAERTWRACAKVGVPGLQAPHAEPLSQAVTELMRQLDEPDPPPDADFDAVKRGLATLTQRTDKAIAGVWQRFARSKAESAGLESVRVLPPATKKALSRTIDAVQRAITAPPADPSQVEEFASNLTDLERQINDAHVRDLPALLVPVFERLNGGGFPLYELTTEQLRLLYDGGFTENLVLRWNA
jgi:hypothetical protein